MVDHLQGQLLQRVLLPQVVRPRGRPLRQFSGNEYGRFMWGTLLREGYCHGLFSPDVLVAELWWWGCSDFVVAATVVFGRDPTVRPTRHSASPAVSAARKATC
jgi:hypothetical protein